MFQRTQKKSKEKNKNLSYGVLINLNRRSTGEKNLQFERLLKMMINPLDGILQQSISTE